MAYDLLIEVYDFVERRAVIKFYDETLTPDKIREEISADGYKYAYILDSGVRIGYLAYYVRGTIMVLSKFYLLKEYRGKGKGTAPIHEMVSIAKGMGLKGIVLCVNSKNGSAIRMYKKVGFEDTGIVRKGDGYETITMRYNIE